MRVLSFMLFLFFMLFIGCDKGSTLYEERPFSDDFYEESSPDDDFETVPKPDNESNIGGGGSSGSGGGGGSTSDDKDFAEENDEDSALSLDDDSNGEFSDWDHASDEDKDEDENQDSLPLPDEDDATAQIYSSFPDVGNCETGEVTMDEKIRVLDRINDIRSLHNLLPLSYDESGDVAAAECSLAIAANKKLSHEPDDSWLCYSNDVYDGCSSSNIYVSFANHDISNMESVEIVDAFMTDEKVADLGHRRWLIDPWLASVSFGRVDDTTNFVIGAAIKVLNEENAQQDISGSDIEFVAYPFENYPLKLYNDNVMMSFSLVSDKFIKQNNKNVDFASAAIAITDPNNKVKKIREMAFDKKNYGIPNNIRWFADGIEPNVKYNVVITNVFVGDVSKEFSYWFELQ